MHNREVELENKIWDLENELRAKSDFISTVTHQLRTPLSALKWTFSMMLGGDLGEFSETQRTIIARGMESSQHMIKLLADVSAANHVSEWIIKLHPEPMSIRECIRSTMREFADEARGRDIALDYADVEVPNVLADRERICLVIENLVENAIKYNRAGGSVTIGTEVLGDTLIVSIRDTGMGIPASEQSGLFTKFFRASNAKEYAKGSGLGLFVGKRIVESHHGSIWFESTPDIGTTFFFSLPLAK